MPETLERSSGEHHRPDCGIDSKSDKAASVPDNENTSTRTSRRSNSALPFPFDSESSLDQENGSNGAHEICVGEVFAKLIGMAAKHASLGSRIQKALGLSKKYPPGFTKGLVDQIIRSCEPSDLSSHRNR